MSDARTEILQRIRAGLRDVPAPTLPAPYAGAALPPSERRALFEAVLTRVGGVVHVARAESEVAARVCAILTAAQAQRVIVSDARELAALASSGSFEALAPSAARAELLRADAGLTLAQWGIAETGTLVLESSREHHRLASLLPPLHVAVLRERNLLGTLGDALRAIRVADGTPSARTVTFITGPSRTADIELELVVGVHGPKHLHVILCAEE
jgi:L-lactate dehydrogenase complex protein LldG